MVAESQRLHNILADGYLDDLGSRSLEELRGMRDACEEEESAISYRRRVVQGKLDIVRAEARRRDHEGEDVGSLLSALPDILAGDHHPTPPEKARPTRFLVPAPGTDDPTDQGDDAGGAILGDVRELTTDELVELVGELQGVERHLSDVRLALFARIDGLKEEIAERYRTGEAQVDEVFTRRP